MCYFLYSILAVSLVFFVYKRLNVVMLFFQQEEYDNRRFFKYIFRKLKLVDKKLTAAITIALLVVLWFGNEYKIETYITLLSAILFVFGILQFNPSRGKKPLVVTTRVKRIVTVFYGLFFAFAMIIILHFKCLNISVISLYIFALCSVQIIPFFIILANLILVPFEKRVQKKYYREAKEKIAEYKPIVIGITGSYGKTSVKHILAHILEADNNLLFTPGSVNTLMGVTRIIREKLQRDHKYFIVEMGAYGIGSIEKLCELVPPNYAMITSIGDAHYERFKTVENVARAKFEVAHNVFKNGDGFVVINKEMVDENFIKWQTKEHKDQVKLVGKKKDKEYETFVFSNGKETKDGVEFEIELGGKKHKIKAPIYGEHQIQNISLAVVMAHSLGMKISRIAEAAKTLKPATHRLEVKQQGRVTMIDNAYNSNFFGFSSAIKTLDVLKKKGGRSILVTPGIVELGKLHEEQHFELGKRAGKLVDVAIVVVPDRIKSFIDGFNSTAKDGHQLIPMNNFKEAMEWLNLHLRADDVVLLENDLPDLFESKLTL